MRVAVAVLLSASAQAAGIGGGEEGLFIIKLRRSKSRKGKKEEGVKAEEEVKSEAAERREKE
ncbi:MAG: hypothetical protein ACXQT6_04645 [Candidatus Methanospirareceae archaeon]